MKNFKIFFLATVAIATGLFIACDDSDFKAGPGVKGAQVYFPENIASTFSISDDVTSIAIPVKRIETTEALTVAIVSEASDLFTIPSSVSFTAGQASSDLLLTFDRTKLVDGTEYPISFIINDENNTTPYGNRTLNVKVMPWPWEFIKDKDGNDLKTGKFREGWLGDVFSGNKFEIDATMYKHKSKPGIYMVEEMFGWTYMTEFFGKTKEQLSAQFSYTPSNITIDCTDPNAVKIGRQWTGITENSNGYGNFDIATFTTGAGTLVNGVITFPKGGLAAVLVGLNRTFTCNTGGTFRIVLPGSEAVDYALAATYDGMKVGADNVTTSAVIDFAYGADVTGISYVFVPGDQTGDADDIAGKIVDGTAGDILQVENFVVGGAKVTTQTVFADAGTYTVVALPKDKAGVLVPAEVAATKFYFPGLGPTSPLLLDYTKDDVVGIAKTSYFKTWDLWGVDYYGDSDDRVKLGQIEISENTANDTSEVDAINIKGLTLGAVADDTIDWEYYGGVIYSRPGGTSRPLGTITYQGATLYLGYITVDGDGVGSATNDYMMFAGQVEEGYIAFVSNNANYDFNGLLIQAYNDTAMTDAKGDWEFYYKMMLVDPALGVTSFASRARVTESELKTLHKEMSVLPRNFVELQGRKRIHALIDEIVKPKAFAPATISDKAKSADKEIN
ncbi:hypothetical protein [uncultured Alistipes sp.]|jgi:hypothetical protein|uniref:hypothetical protein n=1 Tax=uncultured Alistipes sp. TaxID=538949 RepID=UPI0025F5EA14|nr:hypothetical protein [uncultured Alistipes sp.]